MYAAHVRKLLGAAGGGIHTTEEWVTSLKIYLKPVLHSMLTLDTSVRTSPAHLPASVEGGLIVPADPCSPSGKR